MLHFFPRYSDDVSDTPFAAELRRLQVPHRFFARRISLLYRSVSGLLFRVYPRLLRFALSSAVRSLLLSRPRPSAAIVGSDAEALVFGVLRRVFRLPTLIVFETLIITRLGNPLYRRYYAFILSLIDLGICHSRLEVARYRDAFPDARCRFVCIPYGTTVTGRDALVAGSAARASQDAVIVAAGRSGRDYRTLIEAVRSLPCTLHIICDTHLPALGGELPSQVTVLRDCFGDAYIQALADALFVAIPLGVDDLSAGQMVLLQARALHKAIVITRTSTIAEYATDNEDALLVEKGDVEGWRAAIQRLIADSSLRARLGANSAARFERDHSTEAYVRSIVANVAAVRDGG